MTPYERASEIVNALAKKAEDRRPEFDKKRNDYAYAFGFLVGTVKLEVASLLNKLDKLEEKK